MFHLYHSSQILSFSSIWYKFFYLFIYLALPTRAGSPQQHVPITVGPFCLTHTVNFPCGRKPEYPEETHDFRQSVDFYSFHMRTGFESHWESSHWDLNLRPQRWKASALTTWPPAKWKLGSRVHCFKTRVLCFRILWLLYSVHCFKTSVIFLFRNEKFPASSGIRTASHLQVSRPPLSYRVNGDW
jgi:hypothetical protein